MDRRILLVLVAIIVGVGGYAGYFFFIDEGEGITEGANVEQQEAETEEQIVYVIDDTQSTAEFTLQEDLFGERVTVVGVVDNDSEEFKEIDGNVLVDFGDPANSNVSMIQVNVQGIETDRGSRDRWIHSTILETGDYQFVEFMPTEVVNFPESPEIGQPLEFQIVGDLTIRDITQTITFDAIVTLVDETRMEGSATGTVLRSVYSLQIPDVPSVANVTDEVQLTINFVALASEDGAASNADSASAVTADEG